ncbi:MAG: thioredoxin domain-containing protein [Planctomycetes bacterium]|nr:thioredoxin domain-containing protein [Planctomycetota bacterium]
MSTHRTPNALANESSPYLLQHAYNPVAWMPWGEAAFAKAKAEDKPIFLSIGYATCHWCHVMERESFENEEVAQILNENFVPIKVDREERPDVDAVYMAVTQGMSNGRGGWPMSVWLFPDRRPITAGTYFPPEDRWGRPGFKSILRQVSEVWKNRREELEEQAKGITEWLNAQGKPTGKTELGIATLKDNAEEHARRFDHKHGGFESAPKFPTPHRLSALLRTADILPAPESINIAVRTLDAMADGGIHDQVGGGFHRYSTDREWLTPHFEKMLYDQALLVEAYLDAWQVTGEPRHAAIVRDILEYTLRDLRDEGGAFHSAEDADSEGVEGKFYVWSMAELKAHLGGDAAVVASAWGCADQGNFHDEASGTQTGDNILHLPRPLDQTAKLHGLEPATLRATLQRAREILFEVRTHRVRPLLDDKVLTDWNGLMLGAIARAGVLLDEKRYLLAATQCAEFLSRMMWRDGRLLHRYRKGSAGILGFVDDYAFFGNGLFQLYQATLEPRWLDLAATMGREMVRLFWHEGEGLFHTQGSDDPDKLIAPNRSLYDGAIPSGNSAAALLLARLGRTLQDEALLNVARRTLESMSPQISGHTPGFNYALAALEHFVLPGQEIVIAGEMADSATKALIAETRKHFLPRAILIHHEPGTDGEAIRKLVPYVANQLPVQGQAAAYVCEHYTCKAPVTTPQVLARLIRGQP